MGIVDTEPRTLTNVTIWYIDDLGLGETVRQENVTVHVYDNWVKIVDVMPTWIPAQHVEKILG